MPLGEVWLNARGLGPRISQVRILEGHPKKGILLVPRQQIKNLLLKNDKRFRILPDSDQDFVVEMVQGKTEEFIVNTYMKHSTKVLFSGRVVE